MLSDSYTTQVDWSNLGKNPDGEKSECTFWTGLNGQICVQYFRPGTDVHYHPHTHSEYTAIICLAGEIVKKQLGQTQIIGPGEAMMGNFGVEHSSHYLARNGRLCEAVSVSFDRRLMNALTKNSGIPPADEATCPAFLGKADESSLQAGAHLIAQELRGKQLGHKLVIETQAVQLLVETLRSWPRANIEKIKTDATPRLPRKDFIRAYEFMRWCRKENFRLKRLCQFLSSSEERFNRLFLASARRTPASFYNWILLDRACDLLRNEKLSIKEISFELGFRTCSHFIAAFRRVFATSPQEYRRQYQQPRPARFDHFIADDFSVRDSAGVQRPLPSLR